MFNSSNRANEHAYICVYMVANFIVGGLQCEAYPSSQGISLLMCNDHTPLRFTALSPFNFSN